VKILGIMGSSRRDGNTNDLLDVALSGASEAGASVEKMVLLDHNLHHIYNCQDCKGRGSCPPDDYPLLRDRIFDADGLIWASPLYWYTISGLMKVLLDRLCCTMYVEGTEYFRERMSGKAAAVIMTQEEADLSVGLHLLGTMKLVFGYELCQWEDLGFVQAIGGSRGTAMEDEAAVREAHQLGQRMARFRLQQKG
jgi:multimeric flavodoxin WrbA